MHKVFKALCFWLLLIATQQGAVVHEVGHFAGSGGVSTRVDAAETPDAACGLCSIFAQVVTPAFSHAFHVPPLVRAVPERFCEPRFAAILGAVPTPRSRGPPASA